MSVIATAAKLSCLSIYDPIDDGVFGKIYRIGETVCGTVLIDGIFYIANQGTENVSGVAADFDCFPIVHPVLGCLHAGFYENIPALIDQLTADIPNGVPIVVTGHSKGAGEASQLGPCLKLAGFNVIQAILFACPHGGGLQYSTWLQENLPGISFRNAPTISRSFGDPVPEVPIDPYCAPYPFTYIDVAPGGLESLVSVNWHRAKLYYQGATEMFP